VTYPDLNVSACREGRHMGLGRSVCGWDGLRAAAAGGVGVRTDWRFLASGPRSAWTEGSMNRFRRVRVHGCVGGWVEVGGGGSEITT